MASLRIVLVVAVACVLVLGLQEASAATNPCPTVCTLEYAPVCGRRANGSTREFSNGCALRIYKCKNPGEIVSSRKGRCK